MVKQVNLTIESNEPLNHDVWRMVLTGDCSAISVPGQFIDIKLEHLFLRRPISVYDWTNSSVTIVYKLVGKGTEQMATLTPGTVLSVLTGLGNGYTIEKTAHPVLIGGGVGVPPLYALAKRMISEGLAPTVILGFNTESDMILTEEFKALGLDVRVATASGEVGVKGFVTDVLKDIPCDMFYACGPIPMLKAITAVSSADGQMSFEERMGCGFGACVGCTMQTKNGPKRVCKDGPVMRREEVVW